MNVTVSRLNAYVRQMLASDAVLDDLGVEGEISGLKFHSSGHIYFTLKDESAAIRCAFFRQNNRSLTFQPKDGMKVIARGRVGLYERDGTYQLYVEALEENGAGKLYEAFEKLKKKLEAEGLFDPAHKKTLPRYIRKLGVATSPTGAVFHDIMNVSLRRCPGMQIVLAPVKVQGDDAPASIVRGLQALDARDDVDVIIVGRGGGSMEDLWCFNDETLARTIYALNKPVISAVGHETDFTIADFVADLRAPTPSAAAEVAVFDHFDATEDVEKLAEDLWRTMRQKLDRTALTLNEMERLFSDPGVLLEKNRRALEALSRRLDTAQETRFSKSKERLSLLSGKIDALSPLKVLARGYAVAMTEEGKTVTKPADVSAGDRLTVKLAEGSLKAEVL